MFILKTFERQMCSGSQTPASFSSCLMSRFAFSLYSTSLGPTIHLDYDQLECDTMQVHRYWRFGRICFLIRSSKFLQNIVACESEYTASRKTKLIRSIHIFRNLKVHNPTIYPLVHLVCWSVIHSPIYPSVLSSILSGI